jgi:hypothetical protein
MMRRERRVPSPEKMLSPIASFESGRPSRAQNCRVQTGIGIDGLPWLFYSSPHELPLIMRSSA